MSPRIKIFVSAVASIASICAPSPRAQAAPVEPEAFVDPMVFDFSDLATGTRLGQGYSNPYAELGIEFTGYVANYSYGDLDGNHLATGFANSPPEPFVVRVALLDVPALRVGGFVWPECGGTTSITAFGDDGGVLDSFSVSGCSGTQFMGLEAAVDDPIHTLEWRGLLDCDLTTFPRVDGVMIELVPEPATLFLVAASGLFLVNHRRPAR